MALCSLTDSREAYNILKCNSIFRSQDRPKYIKFYPWDTLKYIQIFVLPIPSAGLMTDGRLRVEDHLVDASNKPIQVRKSNINPWILLQVINSLWKPSLFLSLATIRPVWHLQAIVNFDAIYKSPDDEDGNFEPSNLVNVIVHQQQQQQQLLHKQPAGASSGGDDDQQMLLMDIEQNIANLEKSMKRGGWKANWIV